MPVGIILCTCACVRLQCPACGMLLEKIDGDEKMMCGCEARVAGGTTDKALRGGGYAEEGRGGGRERRRCHRREVGGEGRRERLAC